MLSHMRPLTLLVIAHVSSVFAGKVFNGQAYTGIYWDCCKPSCSWEGKADLLTHPPQTCDINENPLDVFTGTSACGTGGTVYACNTQQPWAVNDTFSYGFVSASIVNDQESDWCCSCYELDFTSGPVAGKKMIVQTTNTGYDDPGHNRFGLGIPGSADYAGACATQYGGTFGVLGKNNSGVANREQCSALPAPLKDGCLWRFDWYLNASFPNITFSRVACPVELTNKTGCIRADEAKFDNGTLTSTSSASQIRLSTSSQFLVQLIWIMLFSFMVASL